MQVVRGPGADAWMCLALCCSKRFFKTSLLLSLQIGWMNLHSNIIIIITIIVIIIIIIIIIITIVVLLFLLLLLLLLLWLRL